MFLRFFVLLSAVFVLSGYSHNHSSELLMTDDLLKLSSSRVVFVVSSNEALDEFKGWVYNEKPYLAHYSCSTESCLDAVAVLDGLGVPLNERAVRSNSISLYYKRMVALSCDSDQTGCNVSTNLIGSVSNWNVFKFPGTVGGLRAENLIRKYNSK